MLFRDSDNGTRRLLSVLIADCEFPDTSEQIRQISQAIIGRCIELGFNFTDLLHIHLFKNNRGAEQGDYSEQMSQALRKRHLIENDHKVMQNMPHGLGGHPVVARRF